MACEGFFTRQELVQHHATGKNVAAQIYPHALKLLGRHVRRCAQHGASLRQLGRFRARNAEIGNLHPAVGQHDQVGGLDVAVGDPLAMGMRQRIQNFQHDAGHLGQRKTLVGVKVVLELPPLDKFHGDEGNPLPGNCLAGITLRPGLVVLRNHLAIVVHANDAGVVQPPCGLRLTLEPRQHIGCFAPDQLRRQDRLDGNPALQNRIEPFINDAHAAFAKLTANQVLADMGHSRHGSSQTNVFLGRTPSFIRGIFSRCAGRQPLPLKHAAIAHNCWVAACSSLH